MSLRGALLSLGVLAVFLAIFVPIARRVNGGRDEVIDAQRMRHVYVALSLYEITHDGLPAPNLGLIRPDVEVTDLQSVADPNVGTGTTFPLDPALPNLQRTSPTRVSWSYRWHWPKAGDPAVVRLDPRKGLLASWWTGPILRVNTDGAMVKVPRTDSSQLIFADLFGK